MVLGSLLNNCWGLRTVFNLFAVEGYSHAEIAHLLQISESTSKSQYRKARLSLTQSYQSIQKINNHESSKGI
jgi:RNA polymerase sigma-70 factor (ECF subfamily)